MTKGNVKVYLEECYFCRQSKVSIKRSQSVGDPIFCADVDYFGECTWERDRHCFVVTQQMLDAEKAEDEMISVQIRDMAVWWDEAAKVDA